MRPAKAGTMAHERVALTGGWPRTVQFAYSGRSPAIERIRSRIP